MEALRKYFVGEDAAAEELSRQIWTSREQFLDNVAALREEFGATAVMIRENSRITNIAYPDDSLRTGIKGYTKHYDRDLKRDIYLPKWDYRLKTTKTIMRRFEQYSLKRSPSDVILDHYDAHRHVPQDGSLAISVGHPVPDKKRVTLSVPYHDAEDDDASDNFVAPDSLREIPMSEYIFLTQEFKPEKTE